MKDVRKEMSRGSRELLADVENMLREARKNLRRVSGRVTKDLEEVQKASAGKRTTQRGGSARTSKSRGGTTRTTRARSSKR